MPEALNAVRVVYDEPGLPRATFATLLDLEEDFEVTPSGALRYKTCMDCRQEFLSSSLDKSFSLSVCNACRSVTSSCMLCQSTARRNLFAETKYSYVTKSEAKNVHPFPRSSRAHDSL